MQLPTVSRIVAALAVAGLTVGTVAVFIVGPRSTSAVKDPTPLPTTGVSQSPEIPSMDATSRTSKSPAPKKAKPSVTSATPSPRSPSPPKPVPTSTPTTPAPKPKPTSKPPSPKPSASTKPTPKPTTPKPTPTQSQVQQVYAKINQERAKAGLGIIYRTDKLESSAQAWSVHMYTVNDMFHSNPLPPGVFGECVAQGYPSADAVMTAWMNSPGHRAIILGNYSQVGVGHVSSNGGWWTLQFA